VYCIRDARADFLAVLTAHALMNYDDDDDDESNHYVLCSKQLTGKKARNLTYTWNFERVKVLLRNHG